MQTLISQLQQTTPSLRPQLETVQQASTLQSMILAAWKLGLALALLVVQEILQERGKAPTEAQGCPKCQAHLRSKGLLPRQLTTILGLVYWERRVLRCPKRCEIGQIAPFDKTLGIEAHQGTSAELKAMACALAVFVPFGTAAVLLQRIGGVVVCPVAIWHWVQAVGTQAKERLEAELEALAAGKQPETEVISAETAANPLVLGADGVMVPFRPQEASPKGKTRWQEVKVGILARLKCATNRDGQSVTRLEQRRLVAVRGSVDDLKPRLWSEALRQGILTAKTVVWISDGGRGFWRMFDERFAQQAVAVLDFYHAAQNLWKAARDWLDGRTSVARDWFKKMRHQLRHGEENAVLAELQTALALNNLPAGAHHTLQNVYDYLVKHRTHISYQKFEQLGLPLGSGMVESACKWLIQQRFKGVGMRWSEDGFDHLLFLRLAWVNNRFDTLFSPTPSPNG